MPRDSSIRIARKCLPTRMLIVLFSQVDKPAKIYAITCSTLVGWLIPINFATTHLLQKPSKIGYTRALATDLTRNGSFGIKRAYDMKSQICSSAVVQQALLYALPLPPIWSSTDFFLFFRTPGDHADSALVRNNNSALSRWRNVIGNTLFANQALPSRLGLPQRCGQR